MSQYKFPSAFTERMEKMLGDEYPAFINELENGEPSKALFFNGKHDIDIEKKLYLTPIPFAENSYYFDFDGIGNTPLHHGGAFYIQDPSAMATIASVRHLEFKNLLDCCASPGGKTLSASLLAKDGGITVSNEFSVSRCKTLVGNIERFAMKNVIVTNYDMTEKNDLHQVYPGFFDLVICDAPCSGEGMFRKYPEQALGDWSVGNVLLCARRQSMILDNAASLVKNGGYLLYSTCTFSMDENELQIDSFLKSHPEFSLVPVSEEVIKVTSDGYIPDGCDDNLRMCRRFYPHISKGEGQFIALMQKSDSFNSDKEKSKYVSPLSKPSEAEIKALREFVSKAMTEFDFSKVYKYNDNLIYIDFDGKIPSKKVFSCGVKLGVIEKNRFVPHHQLFKCFSDAFKNIVDLTGYDTSCEKYLHGEVFDFDIPDGWCVVEYCGFVLGGGKTTDNCVKNHYPKGLRKNCSEPCHLSSMASFFIIKATTLQKKNPSFK